MPLFEYRCEGCEERFERFVSGRARPACPKCESRDVKKLLSVFAVSSSGSSSPEAASGAGACGSCGDPRPGRLLDGLERLARLAQCRLTTTGAAEGLAGMTSMRGGEETIVLEDEPEEPPEPELVAELELGEPDSEKSTVRGVRSPPLARVTSLRATGTNVGY